MTLKISSSITIVLLLLFLIITTPAFAQEPQTEEIQESAFDLEGDEFVPGELLVKFKPTVGVQDNRGKLARVNGAVVETKPAIDVLRVKIPKGREWTAMNALRTRADVEFVEPNYIARVLAIPNDSSYSSQWGLKGNTEFEIAWDVTQGNGNIIIAVVDTGIDLDHPDFNCTVLGGASKLTAGVSFVEGTSSADDDFGHGTHVAGIAGACTNNLTGIAGAAPHARLMPVKVLNSSGSGSYSDVANGIIYAADQGAKIINLSLGGEYSSSTVADAVQYAQDRGSLVIASAGNYANQGNPVIYPAAYPAAMAVAATDEFDNWAYFSEFRPYVEVAAPGVYIYSTLHSANYGSLSGTSMAAPHVAGLAALIWSVDPGLTNDQVRQKIQATANDLGPIGKDDYFGYGRINAWQALESYATVTLEYSSGGEVTRPISFLSDEETASSPSVQVIRVSKASEEPITWSLELSPNPSWLELTEGPTGLSASEAFAEFELSANRPSSYGTYTTNLVITGTTSSGATVGREVVEVKVTYVPEIQRTYFPIVLN